jgi:hypothetical protein
VQESRKVCNSGRLYLTILKFPGNWLSFNAKKSAVAFGLFVSREFLSIRRHRVTLDEAADIQELGTSKNLETVNSISRPQPSSLSIRVWKNEPPSVIDLHASPAGAASSRARARARILIQTILALFAVLLQSAVRSSSVFRRPLVPVNHPPLPSGESFSRSVSRTVQIGARRGAEIESLDDGSDASRRLLSNGIRMERLDFIPAALTSR